MNNVLELFRAVSTFVFDVDGVMTDGGVLLLPGSYMVREMNIKDGYALQLAVKKGYHVIVISAGASEEVVGRLSYLGIKDIRMKVRDKESALSEVMETYRLKKEEVLYMGDDIPDIMAMKISGLPCCPLDAAADIKAASQYISPFAGGKGCVRDVIEKTMKLQQKWILDTSVRSK